MTQITNNPPINIKTMQAIEFEAVAVKQTIQIPDYIPDAISLRVLLLIDDTTANNESDIIKYWKSLLSDEESRS